MTTARQLWEAAYCRADELDGYLKKGWEPFAVDKSNGLLWYHLKRRAFTARAQELDPK